MRYLLIILCACTISFTSCKVYKFHGEGHVAPQDPHVELKTGQVIQGEKVERVTGFHKDRIVIDSQYFKSKDVAYYSNGYQNYANVGGKDFAMQIAGGNINVYRLDMEISYNDKFNNSTKSGTAFYYYIQQDGKKEVQTLSFRHITPMIPDNTSSFEYLKHLTRNRNIAKTSLYGGMGLFVLGAIASTIQLRGSNANAFNVGELCMGLGLGFTITGRVGKRKNYSNLLKVIEMRNNNE